MHLGLIHTHATLPELRAALAALRGDWLKIVPAWWPHGPAPLRDLPVRLVVRTSWGDPSYDGGSRAYPRPSQVVAEVAPYLAVRPDAVIEIGNEPSGHGLDVQRYAGDLGAAVTALRAAYPQALILPPAHSPHAPDRAQWLHVLGPQMRQCDALTIHGYSDAEVRGELTLIRQHVSGAMPVWLTEVNYPEPMLDADRAKRLATLLRDLPGVPVSLLYHLDTHPAPPLPQQGAANYRLSLGTLEALGRAMQEPTMTERDVRADLAIYRTQTLHRGAWLIGTRARTTAITLHYNGPAVPEHRRRGPGVLTQLRADLEWQTRPGWGGSKDGGDGLQYHAAVDADGVVWYCRDAGAKLWHTGHAVGNAESLSLHLLLGQGQDVTDAQWAGTVALLEQWRARYGIPLARVLGHQEWTARTACPGPAVMERLKGYRAGVPVVAPPAVRPQGLRRFVVDLPASASATVRQGPSRRYPIAAHLRPGHLLWVSPLLLEDEADETIQGERQWAHMAHVPDVQGDLGFVHCSALREIV